MVRLIILAPLKNQKIESNCSTNMLCSSSKSACAIEKGVPKIRDENSSSSLTKDFYCSIHIGVTPRTFDVRFCSVEKFSYGICFSTKETPDRASDLVFRDMKSNGIIFTVWYVKIEASNVILINCPSGVIAFRKAGGTCTFYDSIIGSISTAEITISKNVSTSNLQIIVNYECPIQGMILCSTQILIRKTRFIGLFLFLTIHF